MRNDNVEFFFYVALLLSQLLCRDFAHSPCVKVSLAIVCLVVMDRMQIWESCAFFMLGLTAFWVVVEVVSQYRRYRRQQPTTPTSTTATPMVNATDQYDVEAPPPTDSGAWHPKAD